MLPMTSIKMEILTKFSLSLLNIRILISMEILLITELVLKIKKLSLLIGLMTNVLTHGSKDLALFLVKFLSMVSG